MRVQMQNTPRQRDGGCEKVAICGHFTGLLIPRPRMPALRYVAMRHDEVRPGGGVAVDGRADDQAMRELPNLDGDALPSRRALPKLLVPPALVSFLCLAAGQVHYLLSHTLAEVFSVVIALTALVVVTTSNRFTRNHYAVHVAVAIGWCAGLDLLRTVVYQGMGFVQTEGANTPYQF